jgi:hypothetical protein
MPFEAVASLVQHTSLESTTLVNTMFKYSDLTLVKP